MFDQEAQILETIAIATAAFQALAAGLAGGDWEPFFSYLSEDFCFWFPAGPFRGWNHGQERARAFFATIPQFFPDGLSLTIQQITSNATTVVFEVRSEGMMAGHPYENQAAIALEVRDGKISSYREYLGVVFQLPR